MDSIQIMFNSFVVVVLMIKFADRIFDHLSRLLYALLSFLCITGVNALLLLNHFSLSKSISRATAIGAMFVIVGFLYVIIKRRLR